MKKNLFAQLRSFNFFKKQLTILALVSFSFLSATAQSGFALNFDGTDDRVDLPNILTASYTKEAWVYAPLDNPPFNNQNIVSGTATAFWFPGNQGFRLSAGHNPNYIQLQDPTPMVANTWTHVAVTYDAATTTMTLYKNGIVVDVDNTVPTHSESTLHIGAFIGANYYKGLIDEVRIWSVALTQAEIRDWMVRKVTATHPQYANMLAYYKADEGVGTNLDDSRNSNDGTLVGGTAWAVSGASLGDESVHDYVNATKTATITHTASGESLSATATAGAPAGIHVYRIDSRPTTLTGTVGTGGNNKYFGVFVAGGTAPTFDAVYTYNTSNVETSLRLYERVNNASPWSDANAVQDVNANTLTDAGQAGISAEYILGSTNFPLPVKFTDFTVSKERGGVKLAWTTAEEVNNAGFVIQRSTNGSKWQDLSFVNARNSVNQSYGFLDANPAKGLNYFRLKQTDGDGKFTYSEIRSIVYITKRGVSVYPSPATDKIVLDFDNESLLNTEGKIVNANGILIKRFTIKSLQEHIPVSSLSKGVYMLQLADGSVHKFIKQ